MFAKSHQSIVKKLPGEGNFSKKETKSTIGGRSTDSRAAIAEKHEQCEIPAKSITMKPKKLAGEGNLKKMNRSSESTNSA